MKCSIYFVLGCIFFGNIELSGMLKSKIAQVATLSPFYSLHRRNRIGYNRLKFVQSRALMFKKNEPKSDRSNGCLEIVATGGVAICAMQIVFTPAMMGKMLLCGEPLRDIYADNVIMDVFHLSSQVSIAAGVGALPLAYGIKWYNKNN